MRSRTISLLNAAKLNMETFQAALFTDQRGDLLGSQSTKARQRLTKADCQDRSHPNAWFSKMRYLALAMEYMNLSEEAITLLEEIDV